MFKRLLGALALVVSLLAAPLAYAQFVPSAGFQTINNACGTYFLQSGTYYSGSTGLSVGSTLPYCPNPFSVMSSKAASFIYAQYTNATLPTCNAASAGVVAVETDGAASPVYAATATGSGTLMVTVLCTNSNGTYNWTNH